jgi:putative transposase
MADETETPLNNVIRIDDERIKGHLDRVVRGTVEETLNALLDAEADRLCNAQRYERTDARRDTRAGHYERGLHTKAGEVTLKVPKLRRQTFETAIIERYRRRETSVEEALIEMYLAGVSVRRVEDITEALCRRRASGTMGHACFAVDGVGPQQEDLRDDRGVAEPADHRRAPVRVP